MAAQGGNAASPGILNFVGGMLLGLVMGSVGAIFAFKDPAPSSKKKSSKQAQPSRPATLAMPREELKMVLCVNQSLQMGKGKIGAQCAHAAVGIMQKYRADRQQVFALWERFGQPKIALKVPSEEYMAELAHKALQNNLPCYIVHDAGRTQIAAGSQTVLAIGPAYKSDIDRITGHLSLL